MTDHIEHRDHLGPEVLDRLAEGRRSSAAVREHLAACEECREELEWLRGFQAAMTRVPDRRPSKGFVDRVMDHVRLPSAARDREWLPGWFGWTGWAAGAAAMVAVSAFLGWLWIASQPEFSVEVMASLAIRAVQDLFLTAAMEIGQFLVTSGIAPAIQNLIGELSTTTALGALGMLGVLGLATAAAALHVLRAPPAWNTVKGA